MCPSHVLKVLGLLYHKSVLPLKCKVTVRGYHPSVQEVLNLKDNEHTYIHFLDQKIQGLKGTAKPSPEVVLDAAQGQVCAWLVEDCLGTGDERLDSHSDGEGVVPGVDSRIMGGCEPEWGDTGEMGGVHNERGGDGERADVQLIELTDWLPLLSLGGLDCNKLMRMNFDLIYTIRDTVQGGWGVVLLATCYAPMGRIMRRAGSWCEVLSGLQFGDSQVLTEQGSKSM